MAQKLELKKCLFHYTKTEHFLSIIKNQELWFNKISKTNDPYENKKFDFYNKSELEADDNDDSHVWFFEQLNRIKNRIVKTFSFSSGIYNEAPLDERNRPGYFYPRMWSQYAENSKGVCLIFNKDKVLSELKKALEVKYFIYDGEIEYKDIIDTTYSKKLEDFIKQRNKKFFTGRQFDAGKIRENLCENIHDYYFTKDTDWRGEKEYRIILINKPKNSNTEEEKCKFNVSDCLECVVLGENFGLSLNDNDSFEIDDNEIQKIRCICQEKCINLKILKRDLYRTSYYIKNLYSKPEPADLNQPVLDGFDF